MREMWISVGVFKIYHLDLMQSQKRSFDMDFLSLKKEKKMEGVDEMTSGINQRIHKESVGDFQSLSKSLRIEKTQRSHIHEPRGSTKSKAYPKL